MKTLRKIAGVLLTIAILILFASPLIVGVIAGAIVYYFLGPETFWEKAVAFLISLLVFLLASTGTMVIVAELWD